MEVGTLFVSVSIGPLNEGKKRKYKTIKKALKQ
jgi:hypothetical protein